MQLNISTKNKPEHFAFTKNQPKKMNSRTNMRS